MTTYKPTFRDSQLAFTEAIKIGVLSDNPNDENYAANYMYMGSDDNSDSFKNKNTREYIICQITKSAQKATVQS